jgi:guanylate kinase
MVRLPHLVHSVSATTRAPRPGERDGVDYRFLTPERFDGSVRAGAFLEWAEVFGNRYGTLTAPVDRAIDAGKDVLLEIDVVGAAQIRARRPQAVLVFLMPPSADELERRLRDRGTEDRAALRRRLREARREMGERTWFDHVLVNDDVERAAGQVADIIVRSH